MRLVIAHARDISIEDGGSVRVTSLARELQKIGHEITLVVPQPTNEIPFDLGSVDIVTVSQPETGDIQNFTDKASRAISILRKSIKISDNKNSVLKIENSNLAGVATFIGGTNYILDAHDLGYTQPLPMYQGSLGPLARKLVQRLEKRGVRNATHIISASKKLSEFFISEWEVDADMVTTVPNGIDLNIRKYASHSTISGQVVFMGSLRPMIDVDIFSRISKLDCVSKMVVIGDGPKKESLLERAEENPKLKVLGYLPKEEAYSIVSKSQVAINPQIGSSAQVATSPVKLYHYAGLQVPIVTTEGPEFAETLKNRGVALTVPPGDYDKFERAIKNAMSESEYERMVSSYSDIIQNENWSKRAEKIDQYVIKN
jgi:glycosyltransferase involved in cell wall biosynthesis